MKDKNLQKRIISIGLSILLVLGVAIGHLPGGVFSDWFMASDFDFSLTQSERALGANVIPNQMKNNSGFMSKYIYTTGGNALNLNGNFELYDWSNIDKDISMKNGNSLTRAKLMHQKNKAWEANYKWELSDAQAALIKDSNYVLTYEGNLFADEHYNLLTNAKNHWDVGTAWLYAGKNSGEAGGYAVWKLTAEKKNDEKAQAVKKEQESMTLWSSLEQALFFRAEHDGCACGSSGVSNSVFYMYDKAAPYIKDVYISRNKTGEGKLNSGDGFVANETGYVVLEFSENIRFSDNDGFAVDNDRLTLNLDAYYCKNNVSVDDAIIYAKMVSLKGNKMIFEFAVPEKTGSELTDVYINGISNTQDFVNSSKEFPLIIYNGAGSAAVGTSAGYTVSNYITDIAGNPLDWTASDKSLNKVYLDNVKPTMTGISMSGSMITESSTIKKDKWPEDINRSYVFAGVGDTICFEVFFSENVAGYNKDDVKAILNLKDANGNYIELDIDRNWGDQFRFQTLTITDAMKVDNYGKPIVITGFEGLANLTDAYGNKMDDPLTSVSMAPAQQIYLDVDAPIISTLLTISGEENAYVPLASEVGEYFTFPIVLKESLEKTTIENTSTITGKEAYFSLLMNGVKDFEWYIDTNQSIDTNAGWKTATTAVTAADASQCKFSQVDGTKMYLHIKLNPNTDYDYATNLTNLGKVCFVGSIYVHAQDYAGNTSSATYAIKHDVDKVDPIGTISEQTNLKIDYTNLNGTLTADVTITDNYAIKSLKYFWTYTPYVLDGNNLVKGTTKTSEETITIPQSELLKEQKETAIYNFDFNEDNNTDRKGEAFLTIIFEDYNGGTGTVTGTTYRYDFTKSIPNYSIKTGSQANPLLLPEVVISAPESTGNSQEADATRTILVFPNEKNSDGTYNYYIWDPWDQYSDATNKLEYTDKNIFEVLTDTNNQYGMWAKVTGNITKDGGKIVPDNIVEVEKSIREEVQEFISKYYGELEMIVITSPDFSKSYIGLTSGEGYTFDAAKSSVEMYTVYLMNGATFNTELTAVEKDGKDATDELNYSSESGKRPAQNIDNVALTLSISNTKDPSYTITSTNANTTENTNKEYGFIPFTSGKAYLYYSGSNKGGTGEQIYEWSLDKVDTQTIVIPEGVAKDTGWYRVEVILDTVDAEPVTTKYEKYFFMDSHVSDVMIHEYYKEYDRDYLYQDLTAKNLKDLAGSTSLEIALDTAPEDWSLNTYIQFGRSNRTDESTYGIQENVCIRVYNKADENYETNAIWVNVSGLSDADRVKYTPVEVSDFKDNHYGTADALQLPLLAGDNLICYEIISTNGIKTSHEIAIYAHTEAVPLELDVEYVISPRTGGIMEFTVSPVQTLDMDLSQSKFNLIDPGYGYADSESYTFDKDMDNEYYLLDQNGNLSTAQCKVENVDGDAPYWSKLYKEQEGNTYCIEVGLLDHEGTISADEIVMTLDADYSALLMGLTGDERTQNTEQISFKVPFNLEKDEQGNYLPWESYTDACYGIYRTQILEYGSDETHVGGIFFKIWGTWRTEPVDEDGNPINEPKDKTFSFTAMDANGNETSNALTFWNNGTRNPQIELGVYVGEVDWNYGDFDIDKKLDENGYVGIRFDRPLSDVNGYGAGKLKEGHTLGQQELVFYTTAPMITKDGIYKFEVTDLFGDTYETELNISGDYAVFNTLGIDVAFSETKATNNDVTVTAEAMLENDYITSITAVTESGKPITGTILSDNPTTATITLSENAKVTIKTQQEKERILSVTNIDKELEPASVIFVDSMGMEIDTTEETLYEKVTAMVVCDEVLYATKGQLNHRFQIGSKKGDTYTFEYSDIAGNTGSITAVLPFNLVQEPQETPVVDDRSPDFILDIYGVRDEVYNLIGNIVNPCDETTDTGIDKSDAAFVSETLGNYIAQKYKLMLDIEDESDVKIMVQENGADAPSSYADVKEGSTVAGVSLSGNSILIENNTTFDLYVIDEENNVTALTDIVVNSIDTEAIGVVVNYNVEKNMGEQQVIATFVPEDAFAKITALSNDVFSKWVFEMNPQSGKKEEVLRYYYILKENGNYAFTYKDEYGNIGQAIATVKGMNNSPAIVNSIIWFGTTANKTPDQSEVVNKDVIAALKMSKAVSEVTLYRYKEGINESVVDETCLGDPISINAPIHLSFTSNNVYVTYENNIDYEIVAEFIAAENGKKGYCKLPKVTCIDKDAPTVAEAAPELSNDKRSLTFTFMTNEPVLFNKDGSAKYAQEFTWIATTNVAQELIFTDKAGNVTRSEITESMLAGIDRKNLSVSFSASADGADATNNPVKDLNVAVGKDIYVKVTKEANAILNDVELGTFVADTWIKVTLPQEAGLHMLELEDVNTREILYKTIAAQPKDNVAPVITFNLNTIALEESVTLNEMNDAIHSGVTITDNKDGSITEYTVTGQPSTVKRGLYELTYTAEDEAGNKVTANRTLYIMQEGTPVIKVNGETAVPYGTVIIKGFDVKLEVEGMDSDLLLVKYKSGIKTVGQMKYGTTMVENMEFTVSTEGFYTIYIRTQDRVEFITQIYVEE